MSTTHTHVTEWLQLVAVVSNGWLSPLATISSTMHHQLVVRGHLCDDTNLSHFQGEKVKIKYMHLISLSLPLSPSSKIHRVAPQVPLSENPISPTTSSTSSPKSKSMRHKNSFSSSIKGVFRRRLGSTGKKGDSEKRNSAPPGTIECERDIDHSNIYWFMLYYSYWWHCWWWSFGC